MTKHDLEAIEAKLTARRTQKKEIALAKAHAEIETIKREADAYWDGLYDAIKAVKEILPYPAQENAGTEIDKQNSGTQPQREEVSE